MFLCARILRTWITWRNRTRKPIPTFKFNPWKRNTLRVFTNCIQRTIWSVTRFSSDWSGRFPLLECLPRVVWRLGWSSLITGPCFRCKPSLNIGGRVTGRNWQGRQIFLFFCFFIVLKVNLIAWCLLLDTVDRDLDGFWNNVFDQIYFSIHNSKTVGTWRSRSLTEVISLSWSYVRKTKQAKVCTRN